MQRGAVVITPNERAARRLRRIYDQQQLKKRNVWRTAKAMSLQAFLIRFWNDAVTEGRILSPVLISQEHSFALWEQIIQASTVSKDILNISGTTELVQQAFGLMQLFGVAAKDLLPLDSVESRTFHQWSAQYAKKLEKEKWMDSSGLCSAVSLAVADNKITQTTEL